MNFTLSTKTFLTILYIVGIIGICSPFQYYFLILTPINLLLTFFFIVKAHKNLNLENIVVLTILILTTWTIEAIGINTGEIFGAYGYGKVLGFKIFSTPPMIGINWAILVLGTGYWLKSIKIKNTLLFSFLGAIIMTILDILIEPVAIKLDFWHWKTQTPPLQNYLAWFIISFIIFILFPKKYFNTKNDIAVWCLGLQFMFFFILNLASYFIDL